MKSIEFNNENVHRCGYLHSCFSNFNLTVNSVESRHFSLKKFFTSLEYDSVNEIVSSLD